MAEITKKISRNIIKLKGALFLRIITNFQNYSPHDKNETEPIWLSPVFAIFQPPPMQGYTRRHTYNQLQVRPDYGKQ